VKILLAAQTASLVAMVCIVMAMVANNQIRNKDHLRPNHEEMLSVPADQTSAQDQRRGFIVAKYSRPHKGNPTWPKTWPVVLIGVQTAN
jgi:hypothetical protein